MIRELLQGQPTLSKGGVQDGDTAATNFAYHNKVVEIPVRDAWQLKLAQVLQVQAQWSATKVETSRDFHDLGESGTLEGKSMTTANLTESNVVPMMRRNHGQAGESAFRCLRLSYDVNRMAPQNCETIRAE